MRIPYTSVRIIRNVVHYRDRAPGQRGRIGGARAPPCTHGSPTGCAKGCMSRRVRGPWMYGTGLRDIHFRASLIDLRCAPWTVGAAASHGVCAAPAAFRTFVLRLQANTHSHFCTSHAACGHEGATGGRPDDIGRGCAPTRRGRRNPHPSPCRRFWMKTSSFARCLYRLCLIHFNCYVSSVISLSGLDERCCWSVASLVCPLVTVMLGASQRGRTAASRLFSYDPIGSLLISQSITNIFVSR